MNIQKANNSNSNTIQLFESEADKKVDNSVSELDENLQKVFDVKSNQFVFDSGVMMASLDSDVDNLLFGLKEHNRRANNFNEFIESIEAFLSVAKSSLTENDKLRLEKHYNKYNNKK